MWAEDRRAAIRSYLRLRSEQPGPSPAGRALTLRIAAKSGEPRWVEVHLLQIAGSADVLVYLTDISERRQLQLQLLQAQKMETVGRLAGGVAHDVNNMLTVILGQSELLLAASGTGQFHEGVAEIRRAAGKAAGVIQQLLRFSRRRGGEPRVVNLNDLIRDMEAMLHRLVGEAIRVERQLDPALGAIRADPTMLEQALLNLATNARDAMAGRGTLTLRTANAEAGEPTLPPNLAPGAYVSLSVTDTGAGMDEAIQRHLFEPFFTTKESGKGTGLGLSIVHRIVEQCQGSVHVLSRPGLGSTFRLYFPRLDGARYPLVEEVPRPLVQD